MGLTNTLVKLLANILEVEEHEIIFDKKFHALFGGTVLIIYAY